jgi:predicted protein tyrosine phosphatase
MGNLITAPAVASTFWMTRDVDAAVQAAADKRQTLLTQQREAIRMQQQREEQEGYQPGHGPRPVLNYLYLGDRFTVRDTAAIKASHIAFILHVSNVGTSEAVYTKLKAAGTKYLRLPADDVETDNIIMEFDKACRFLDHARDAAAHGDELHRGLVYCDEGISRSPTMVLAFLIHIGWTLKGAIEHLKRLNPSISPNRGFFAQLVEYEADKLGTSTVKAEDYDVYFPSTN